MSADENVITRRDGRAGRILLNRPSVLNALDLPMIQEITATLRAWQHDPKVHVVVIEGTGDRAFCAGGDVRELREYELAGERAPAEAFFSHEYALNLLISQYSKPYVALIDGICMGGGIGVSVHAPYRVATEHAMFAMPETAIGFFPDIGATYFLPRLPGKVGFYLGLTGSRMTGADAVHAGFATHYTSRARIHALSEALAGDGAAVLAEFNEPLPPFSLAAHRSEIDRIFALDRVLDMVAELEADGSPWARDTVQVLRERSPSSLCWTLRALERGAGLTLAHALEAELALTRTTMAYPDFAEGVRAMVVDKDQTPRWQPARLEDVDPARIEAMFA